MCCKVDVKEQRKRRKIIMISRKWQHFLENGSVFSSAVNIIESLRTTR